MSDLFSAGAKLASAFGGGHAAYQSAKLGEEERLIKVAGMHADTDRKVDQAIQEQQQRQAIQAVQSDPTLSDTVKALTIGKLGTQFNATQSGMATGQKMGFREAAVDAFSRGDWNGGNAQLAGVSNGPLTLTDVDGNQVVRNKYVTNGEVAPTNVGVSQAFANNARGEASLASAESHRARAAATQDKMENPDRYRAPAGAGKPAAFSDPSQGALSTYFGNPNAVVARNKGDKRGEHWTTEERQKRDGYMRDFDTWRAQHPQFRDGDEALLHYKLRNKEVLPTTGPAPPASVTGAPPVQYTWSPGTDPALITQVEAYEKANGGTMVSGAFAGDGPAAVRTDAELNVPGANNGPGFQVPVVGQPAITPKVAGVPETNRPIKAKPSDRLTKIGGKTVVKVASPAEARAAFAKLGKGEGVIFPNGTVKYKE